MKTVLFWICISPLLIIMVLSLIGAVIAMFVENWLVATIFFGSIILFVVGATVFKD